MSFLAEDKGYMQQALGLAEKGQYSAKPNPAVGCVLVKGGKVVGQGWHQQAGQAHAEVNAIAEAGSLSVDATAYVTLEPCSHTGRTGPCVEALIQAGVGRVVIAMQDPNPLVSGRGINRLEKVGIKVSVGLLEEQALALNESFSYRMQHAKPLVFSKVAMSVDGRTAMASGESKWITGPEARADVHHLRAKSCAIISGISSILADDASLTARDGLTGLIKQPVRIILDSNLKLPVTAKVIGDDKACVVLTCSNDVDKKTALAAAGCQLVNLPAMGARLDLAAVFSWLNQQGFNSVMIESGSSLNGALLGQGLIDQLVVYMAPCIMGSNAKGAFELPQLSKLADKKELTLKSSRIVGDDICLRYNVK